MKIKGFIDRIDINLCTEDVAKMGGSLETILVGSPIATVTFKFIEGDFSTLAKHINSCQIIEINLPEETEKPKKKAKWRIIQIGNENDN